MVSLSLLVPFLLLPAIHTEAQTPQISGGLDGLTPTLPAQHGNKFSIISPDRVSVDLRYSASI